MHLLVVMNVWWVRYRFNGCTIASVYKLLLYGFDSSACATLGTFITLNVSISMVALLMSSLQVHSCHFDKSSVYLFFIRSTNSVSIV